MRRFAMLLAAVALVGAACGGDSDANTSSAQAAGDRLELAAESTAFDRTELTASAGAVVIAFDNRDDGIMHNLHVRRRC